jgi:hypothetical protein
VPAHDTKQEELSASSIKIMIQEFQKKIHEKIGTYDINSADVPQDLQDKYEVYDPMKPEAEMPGADMFTPEGYESLNSAKVLLEK